MGQKEIYQHFNREDQEFIDRCIELSERVIERYSVEVTGFLNPHQVAILRIVAASYQLQVFASSDEQKMEYAKVIVVPDYYQLDPSDFDLALIEMVYASKFHHLTHSQVLGTIVHQLGVERKSFGDILTSEGKIQVFVEQRFVPYFMDHIQKISRVPVKLREVPLSEQIVVEEESQQRDILVSSFRLDKVIAGSFRLSRSQASQFISSGLVKVNYATTSNVSYAVGLNDLVSVRRFGRLKMVSENGALSKFIAAGARLLEAACGPCIGMGQAPKSNGISLRTFNRNFKGRCGTMDAGVYLVSTETAAASALTGYLTDPRELGDEIKVDFPEKYDVSDNYYIYPSTDKQERANVEIVMGPNIKPFPVGEKLKDSFIKKVILKTKDNITTDDICPSNAALLPFRSNIPKLSEHCFQTIIPDFKERAEKNNGGIIVGGDNYGQGSSREHAALLPLYLGIKAVIAKSFARIHKANLINSGILPLEFISSADYDSIDEYDELELTDIKESLLKGEFIVKNRTKNTEFKVKFNGSERELKILSYGGYLSFAMSDEF